MITSSYAFINNNINLLKAGYVLRIPYSPDMIKDSKANSIAQVKLQNQQFQEYKLNRMSQLDATQRQRSEVFLATNARDGELRLLARLILEPVTTISSATSAESSSSSAEIEKIEPKLSRATNAKLSEYFE